MAGRGDLRGRQRRPPPTLLRPLHVPLPVGAGTPGPRAQLHLWRPRRPPPDDAGQGRSVSPGLRLFWPSGRERRHQDRDAPPGLYRRQDRRAQGVPDAPGSRLRLAAGGAEPRPRVRPVEPDHLPEDARGRPRLPGQRPGQLVPGLPDGAGERAGPARRHLRAVQGSRHPARPRAVVPAHHVLRRGAARRPRRPPVARARQDDAAQLDRPVGRSRVRPGRPRP